MIECAPLLYSQFARSSPRVFKKYFRGTSHVFRRFVLVLVLSVVVGRSVFFPSINQLRGFFRVVRTIKSLQDSLKAGGIGLI